MWDMSEFGQFIARLPTGRAAHPYRVSRFFSFEPELSWPCRAEKK